MQQYGIADDTDREYIGADALEELREPHSAVKRSNRSCSSTHESYLTRHSAEPMLSLEQQIALECQVNEKVYAEQEKMRQKYMQNDEEVDFIINANQELKSALKQAESELSTLRFEKQSLERQLIGLKRQYEKEQDQIATYLA